MKVDIVHVKKSKVECTGSKDPARKDDGFHPTGHPKVYLYVEHKTKCPYCSKIFVLDA